MSSFYNKYDISVENGFLSDPIADSDLPEEFKMFAEIIANLESMDGEHYRLLVDKLPSLGHPQSFYVDLAKRQNKLMQKKLYSVFTFIVQKYVRCCGKDKQIEVIPYEIGLIWYHCAQTFSLPTVTTYSALILNNWAKVDPSKPMSMDNIRAIHAISGTKDEDWFYRVHVMIEWAGAKVLKDMFDIEYATRTAEDTIKFLATYESVLNEIKGYMMIMRDGCDPDTYWNHVRIFLSGYTPDNGIPNGLTIRGTDIEPIRFGGGSGAQSSLIQSFDVFLGIEHPAEHAGEFLKHQRAYMPADHVNYLVDLQKQPNVKDIVTNYHNREVTEMYNKVLRSFAKFRAVHYSIVHQYAIQFINKAKTAEKNGDFALASKIQSNNVAGARGTGGIIMEVLDEYRGDTMNTQIGPQTNTEGLQGLVGDANGGDSSCRCKNGSFCISMLVSGVMLATGILSSQGYFKL